MLFNHRYSILIRAILMSLIFLFVSTLFYVVFIGDFSTASYLESNNAWGDQKYYINLDDDEQPWITFVKGNTYYPNLMYRMFPGSMMPSIIVNSIIFGLAFSILCEEKKKYSSLYILLCLPVICYFSIGFTKEAPLILALAAFNLYILCRDKFWGIFGFILMFLVKPAYGFIALPGYFAWTRKNIKIILVAALTLTPIYFWFIKALYLDNYYYERYYNFENSLRNSFPIISIFGNLIAMIKLYIEGLLIDKNESIENIQSDIIIYYSYISTFIIAINYKNFFQPRTYIFLLMFLFLSMGPIYHYRYLMPLLLIWTYIVLPNVVK